MDTRLSFNLNGKDVTLNTDPLRRLIDVLREDFGLTGVKEGCSEGECGACSVLLNGRMVTSCIIPVGAVDGQKVIHRRDEDTIDCLGKVYARVKKGNVIHWVTGAGVQNP